MYAKDPTIDVAHLQKRKMSDGGMKGNKDERSKDDGISVGLAVFDESVSRAKLALRGGLLAVEAESLLESLRLERFVLQFSAVRVLGKLVLPPCRVGGDDKGGRRHSSNPERLELQR